MKLVLNSWIQKLTGTTDGPAEVGQVFDLTRAERISDGSRQVRDLTYEIGRSRYREVAR